MKKRGVSVLIFMIGFSLLVIFSVLLMKLLNYDCPTCVGIITPFILPIGAIGIILVIVSVVKAKNIKKD